MPKRIRISLVVIVSIIILSLAFGAGCILAPNTSTSTSQGVNVNLLNQAWTIISQDYVEPSKVDSTNLNEGAINGMVQALNDPYSAYLSPTNYKLEQSNLQGSFEGVGAQVSTNRNNQIIIIAPLQNSPAAKAGIKTGDIILAVDGQSTQGMSLIEVVNLIRGPAGTAVKLLIQHEGESTPVDRQR
ncbi:MAG: PDZ domain-containing protein [Dehalococcoidales bacterium]|nr:PDZ domain-containing protein [Dehalococcoidales bacterium]